MTQDEAKLLVAKRAAQLVSNGMKVGLGTGSTATLFIYELGKAVRNGLRIEAIATSDESAALAKTLGIPLTNFDENPVLDLLLDLPSHRRTPLIRSSGSWKVDDEQDEAGIYVRVQA